jgi:hypothetical protein
MNDNRIIKYLGLLGVIIFIANFYVFSRFTVDDAFISWRYGRNLIEYGVWGYNPVSLDLTQAYTNPLYAVLSVIPAYLGIDTVLFFKVFSIGLAGFFVFAFARRLHNKIVGLSALAFLFASPSLTIHLFSGLETFAYAAFLGLAFIGLERREYKSATLYVLLALLCRPEAWLWTVLLPLAVLAIEAMRETTTAIAHPRFALANLHFNSWRYVVASTVPGIMLAAMLLAHKTHFGYFLPNTFYVKSASGAAFNPVTFAFIAILGLSPIVIAFISGRRLIPVVILLYFIPVILNYSTSDLQMNYNWRFAFQVFAPVYLYAAYIAAADIRAFRLIAAEPPFKERIFQANTWLALLLGFLSAMYTLQTNRAFELVHLANYYPRALDSHAALGRVLNDINAQPVETVFLLGDAGMAAFHSRAVALDNVGLGSALVAHNGVTPDVLDEYNPEHVFLHANPDTGIWQRFGYQEILNWMEQRQFTFVCDIFWNKDYSLRYFAREANPQIEELCATSREANYVSNRDYFVTQASQFPWFYWKE